MLWDHNAQTSKPARGLLAFCNPEGCSSEGDTWLCTIFFLEDRSVLFNTVVTCGYLSLNCLKLGKFTKFSSKPHCKH